MTYNVGYKVTASDYNNLIATVNSVFGLGTGNSGYGGFSDGSAVSPPTADISANNLTVRSIGGQIAADDWINLKNAYLHCAAHQGVALTVQQRSADAATYTNGQSIFINGIEVFLTTGTNVGSAVIDINNAAIPNVTANTYGPALIIVSTVDLTLAEGSGTALADLSLVAGLHKILPNTVTVGEIIKYFVELTVADQADALYRNDDILYANKDLYAGETPLSVVVLGTSVRTFAWSVQLEHRFQITLPSQDEARAYFNTGGQIVLAGSRSGGSATTQNTDWTNFLAAVGDSIFNTTQFFALTTAYQTFYTYNSDSYLPADPYTSSPMRWIVQAKTDTLVDPNSRGGRGSVITFRSIFQDNHLPFGGTGADTVDGTFTSSITSKYSDTIFHKSAPVYTSLIDITSGT